MERVLASAEFYCLWGIVIAAGDAFDAAVQPGQPRTDESFPHLLCFNHQDLPLFFSFGPALGQGPVLGLNVAGHVLCRIRGSKAPQIFTLDKLTIEQLTRLAHEISAVLWPERAVVQQVE